MLLVDDQKLFRESLGSVLEMRDPRIKIIAQASSGEEGYQLALTYHPDIVLMDVRMPGMDGVESARLIRAEAPEIRIIMLTTFDEDEYVFEALKLGVSGYLLKDIPPAEVESAIFNVYNGDVMMNSGVAAKVINKLKSISDFEQPRKNSSIQELLSPRELDVFRLVALGFDNKGIAEKLYLTEGTVRNHVSKIYSKLDLRDRVQAVIYAMEQGVI